MQYYIYPLITFISIIAGFIHTVTGFGSGIIIMMFLPLYLSLPQASATSTLICLCLNISLSYQLRKEVRKDLLPFPLIVFFTFSALAIHFVTIWDIHLLSTLFSIFLIGLSFYFIIISKKASIHPSLKTAFLCASSAGFTSGLFGISGPTISIYYLAAINNNKIAYLATCQIFFSICSLYTTCLRIINKIIIPSLIPYVLFGILGILVGKKIGLRVVYKINNNTMKTYIYLFIGLSGIITLIKNII